MIKDENLKRRVTIYQVAKESGYSLATISRVINNKDNVTEDTKRKVHEVIERLGYKPSAIAQGLAKSKSTNIGIVVPSAMSTYVSAMLSGMVETAKIYGYQTTLFVTTKKEEEANDVVESVISSNVDGAVIFDDELSSEALDKLVNYSVPLAVIGREIDNENIASIPLDFNAAIKTAVNDYFQRFTEDIIFLRWNQGGNLMKNVEEAARKECERIGKAHQFKTIDVEDSYSKTYEQFKKLFSEEGLRGFIIAPRDSISSGVANAASECEVRIPEDIQILSVIGTKYSKIVRPSLTSFDIDMYEVGSIAMRMLTKLLSGNLKTKVYPFVSTIEHRSSTRIKK